MREKLTKTVFDYIIGVAAMFGGLAAVCYFFSCVFTWLGV